MGKSKMKNARKGKKEVSASRSGNSGDMLEKSTRAGFGLAKIDPPDRQGT